MAHKFTKNEIAQQVIEDYKAVAGKVVLLSEVQCYDDSESLVEDVVLDPPVVARIDQYPTTDNSDLLHWNDEWLDPYLDVSILEPHPALANLRPSWTFGTCRSTKGEVQEAPFVLAGPDLQEKFRDAPGLDQETLGGCAPQPAPAP